MRERQIAGVPRGYSLALNPLVGAANRLLGWPERWLMEPWVRGISIDRPIFVIGAFRSGTTILEQILTGHPQVGHFSFFTNAIYRIPVTGYHLMRWLGRWRVVDTAAQAYLHNPRIAMTPYSAFECEWVWGQAGKDLWDPACPDLTTTADFVNPAFERMLRSTIRRHLWLQGATRFLNKNPIHLLRLGYLHRLFPDALFVYILRDPTVTVYSHYRMTRQIAAQIHVDPRARQAVETGLHLDVLTPRIQTRHYAETVAMNQEHPLLGIAHQTRELHLTALDTLAASPALAARVLPVHYEAIMADPGAELARIWAFVELDDTKAADITRRYAVQLSMPPPIHLTPDEARWQARVRDLVAPVPERFAAFAARRLS